MFDLSVFAQQYDALTAAGLDPITFALCDKRYLLPIDQLPDLVEREGGVPLDPARIPALIEAGWLPALSMEEGTLGFPLYIPARVGLYLRLEREGWSAAELAAAAEAEENLVDNILVSPDTPYEDDDLAIVRIGIADEIIGLRHELRYAAGESDADAGAEEPKRSTAEIQEKLAHAERTAAWFASTSLNQLRSETRAKVARQAFLLRAHFEGVRVWMLLQDRALLESGYSFFVEAQRSAWEPDATPPWTFEAIDWPETLRRHAAVSAEDTPLPIRVPGLVLDGDRVTLASRATPAQYEAAWRTFDLDTYMALVAERAGRRVCERCLAALPDDARPGRRFCSDACRNAEKAEAYRRRHPERVKQSQHRWRSA